MSRRRSIRPRAFAAALGLALRGTRRGWQRGEGCFARGDRQPYRAGSFHGRIAGISGILGRLLRPRDGSQPAQAAAFIAGIVTAPLLMAAAGMPVMQSVSGNLPLMAASGLLVGLGAAYGGGCTSGHGVCGMARLSMRRALDAWTRVEMDVTRIAQVWRPLVSSTSGFRMAQVTSEWELFLQFDNPGLQLGDHGRDLPL